MQAGQERIEEIFSEALSYSKPDLRAAFLSRACGEDQQLRERVASLLAAHEDAEDFFGLPSLVSNEMPTGLGDGPGSRIGRYKLLEQIGEGGFGVVFMAEQEKPVRRKVALKIIKQGMDTKQVVARFEAERQALAMMDHPNIAKVFDAGSTETGRPYFVMELVKGISITHYCDEQRLNARERLDLFLSVCSAVQHAHQRGIIHRDLKPSNVMVTMHDDQAVTKVIDFGIAKATQTRLTDKTLFTEFRQLVGTPAYMSPEQTQILGMDVDTRSDIYSLGVLLYELLTGTTPFDPRQLTSCSFDEMQRMIREVEPPKPSTRVGSAVRSFPQSGVDANNDIRGPHDRPYHDTSIQTVALHRSTDPTSRTRLIRGDLDWIVMKCLEKDRERRYETASGLAEDIQRHLTDEPVQARPPTLAYRTKKFVRRNKLGALAAATISIAILLGLTLATVGFVQARRQSRIARTQAARSEQVSRLLKDMLNGVGPSVALGRDTTMLREIVDQTAARIGTELKEQPEVEIELLLTLGWVYRDLQLYKEMEETARETIRLARAHLGEENLALADALGQLGQALMYLRVIDEAESATRQSIAMQRKLRGAGSLEEAFGLQNLADVLRYDAYFSRTNRERDKFLEEAETALHSSLAIRQKLIPGDSDEAAVTLHTLSQIIETGGKLVEAEGVMRQAWEMAQRLYGDDPRMAKYSVGLGNVLAAALPDRLDDAEFLLRTGLADEIKTEGDGKFHQAFAHWELARVLEKELNLDEAETHYRDAVRVARSAMGPSGMDLPMLLVELAAFLQRSGRLEDARALSEEAVNTALRLSRVQPFWRQRSVEVYMEILTALHDEFAIESFANQLQQHPRAPEIEANTWLAAAMAATADALRLSSRLPQARELAEEAVNICREEPDSAEVWYCARAHQALRSVLDSMQDVPGLAAIDPCYAAWARAELDLIAAETDRQRQILPPDSPELAFAIAGYVSALLRAGEYREAEPLAREVLDIRERKIPGTYLYFNAKNMLGGSLLGQELYDEAAPLLKSAVDGMKQTKLDNPLDCINCLEDAQARLLRLNQETGRTDYQGLRSDDGASQTSTPR